MTWTDFIVGVVLVVTLGVVAWLVAVRVSLFYSRDPAPPRTNQRRMAGPGTGTGATTQRLPGRLSESRRPQSVEDDAASERADRLSPAHRLLYEVRRLNAAGFAVRQFLVGDDAALEVRASLPKIDSYGELRSLDGRDHKVAILFLLGSRFPDGAPQVAAGVSTVEPDGSYGREEVIELRSAALDRWHSTTLLVHVASEILASADAAPAAHPARSLFDEFGKIRAASAARDELP
jgi:hypothetical protein